MANQYWIHRDGKAVGPFTPEQVRAQAAPDSWVSFGDKWVAFRNHPEFQSGPQQSKSAPPQTAVVPTVPTLEGEEGGPSMETSKDTVVVIRDSRASVNLLFVTNALLAVIAVLLFSIYRNLPPTLGELQKAKDSETVQRLFERQPLVRIPATVKVEVTNSTLDVAIENPSLDVNVMNPSLYVDIRSLPYR